MWVYGEDKSIRSLLGEWATRNMVALEAHYNAARSFANLNYWIGIPAVIFAAIVGTSVFASLKKDVDIYIKITIASFSIIAAILSALQTFLKYNERSEKHRLAGARYAAIKREIEQLLAIPEE
jgi:predicted permease